MPPGQDRANLRKLYPTIKSLELAIAEHGQQKLLAKHLGVNTTTLYEHKEWLVKGKRAITNESSVCRMTDRELDERIRQLYGNRNNGVKVYQLTEQYEPHQLGTEGLIPLRMDVSQTSISYWGRREEKGASANV